MNSNPATNRAFWRGVVALLALFLSATVQAEPPTNGFDATSFDRVIGPQVAAPTAPTRTPVVPPQIQAEIQQTNQPLYVVPAESFQQALMTMNNIAHYAQTQDSELVRKQVDNELIYIVLLCSLALITTYLTLHFMRTREHDAKDIVNAAGLNLIIIGTIILVLVVDTSEQLTAAIGVLGAIAGYLFRSMQDGKPSSEKPPAKEDG